MNRCAKDFIASINSREVEAYKAVFDIGDYKIGITHKHTMEVLQLVIEEAESLGHKLIKIVRA